MIRISTVAALAASFLWSCTPAQSATHGRHVHVWRCASALHGCRLAPRYLLPWHVWQRTFARARRHREHRYAAVDRQPHRTGGGLTTIATAAGPVTVALGAADRFRALIADLFADGFRGAVHCFAATGHIRHSLHHSGEACDFAQTGRNRTASIMYRAGAIIARYGLRDGCSFHDCGHVDTGRVFAFAGARAQYVAHRHRGRGFNG